MNKLILKVIWKVKENGIAKTILKKKTVGGSEFNTYQRQCSIDKGIAHKSMERKRKSRNISTQIWQFDFSQRYKKFND